VIDTRVGAYGVIVRDGSVLLSHWTEGGLWTLPGGGLDPGETPADGAVREIREETGYDAELVRILGADAQLVPAERRLHGSTDLHAVQIVYEARIVGGELAHETDGSSDEARWVALTDLGSLPLGRTVMVALAWAGHAEGRPA
jgi:8-oxo-dGTP diphosphatase